jgi:hypothetical protein
MGDLESSREAQVTLAHGRWPNLNDSSLWRVFFAILLLCSLSLLFLYGLILSLSCLDSPRLKLTSANAM